MLKIKTTADIKVSKRVIDQVIGQEEAIEIVKKAAKQRRHILLIGEPGTGKSMLGQALAELLPNEKLVDVLSYPNPTDENVPLVRTIPKAQGREIVSKARLQAMGSLKNQNIILLILVLFSTALPYFLYSRKIFPFDNAVIYAASMITSIVFILGFMIFLNLSRRSAVNGDSKAVLIPKLLVDNAETKKAPFLDATGAHAGALLGDVLHDPLQSFSSSNKINVAMPEQSGQILLQEKQINIVDNLLKTHKDGIIRKERYEAVFLSKDEMMIMGEKCGKVETSEVLSVNRYPKKGELIKITSQTGKELIVTPEHKVAVIGLFNKIRYMRADQLKPWHKLVTLDQ